LGTSAPDNSTQTSALQMMETSAVYLRLWGPSACSAQVVGELNHRKQAENWGKTPQLSLSVATFVDLLLPTHLVKKSFCVKNQVKYIP